MDFYFNLIVFYRKVGIRYMFLFKACHFLPSTFPFWRALNIFVVILAQTKSTYVCLWSCCILFQTEYYFIIKVHELWDGNHRWFSTPASQFISKQVLILEEH